MKKQLIFAGIVALLGVGLVLLAYILGGQETWTVIIAWLGLGLTVAGVLGVIGSAVGGLWKRQGRAVKRRVLGLALGVFLVLGLVLWFSGVGRPQSSPERVTRAYLKAMANGRCAEAKSYLSPDSGLEYDPFFACNNAIAICPLTKATIDRIEVKDLGTHRSEVTIKGRFVCENRTVAGDIYEEETVTFGVEKIKGRWYIFSSSL